VSETLNTNPARAPGRTPDNGPAAPAGQVTCVSMAVPLRFGGTAWLKMLFAAGRRIPKIPEPMYKLAFIHFLRWTILEKVPDGEGGTRELHPACLLFEGDFEGNVFQYVDTFIQAVPVREWAVWNRGFNFPGIRPVARFATWARAQNVVPDHYFFAYPDATTKMVGSGLKVKEALVAFEAALDSSASDEDWYEQFERLLVSVQKDV
jgi:hypothetical protein